MKHLTILLTTATLILASAVNAQNPDPVKFNRYADQNQIIISNPDDSLIIFFGNSITEFWPVKSPHFFPENNIIGRGIAGQTTYQFLLRFRDDVVNLHPAIVVINAATNDIAENTCPYNEARTFGNIKSMVEIAQANNIRVILTATLPAAEFYWNKNITDAPHKITNLNKLIKQYAAQNNIPFVDYHTPLLAPDNKSLHPQYTDDGVHPTAQGYQIMEQLILPEIRNTLGKTP